MIGEFDLIKEIRRHISYKKHIFKGIGDDCAVVKTEHGYLLYTIDNMIEDVHFNLSFGTPYKNIGYKAVTRAVSDIAAMGGNPVHILVSLAFTDKLSMTDFKGILAGIKSAIKFYNIDLIGGDITKSKTTALTISVIGESDTKPVLRSGAKIGDDIYVTGEIGLARAGLELLKKNSPVYKKLISAYEKPKARIDLGQALRVEQIANSMIDISDGLLGDLKHILEESKKGALLDLKSLQIPKILLKDFSKSESLNFILNGGDDYELIFTASERNDEKIKKLSQHFKTPITKIGKIIEKGYYFMNGKIKIRVMPHSYQHSFENIVNK